MTAQTLSDGGYIHVMRCPRCLQPQEVFIVIATRLTVETDGGTLKPTLHAKGVDHICGQRSTIDEQDVVDAVGTRPFDFRDRAAGEHLDR